MFRRQSSERRPRWMSTSRRTAACSDLSAAADYFRRVVACTACVHLMRALHARTWCVHPRPRLGGQDNNSSARDSVRVVQLSRVNWKWNPPMLSLAFDDGDCFWRNWRFRRVRRKLFFCKNSVESENLFLGLTARQQNLKIIFDFLILLFFNRWRFNTFHFIFCNCSLPSFFFTSSILKGKQYFQI